MENCGRLGLPEFALRIARPSDIPSVYRIFEESFQDELSRLFKAKYPVGFFHRAFLTLISHTFVAEEDGEVVGFVSCFGSSKRELIHAALTLLFPFVSVIFCARPSLLKYVYGRLTRANDLPGSPTIACVAVDRRFRGRGFGTMLLKAALDHFRGKEVRLSVRRWRENAYRLYVKLGFSELGRWEDKLGAWIEMKRPA